MNLPYFAVYLFAASAFYTIIIFSGVKFLKISTEELDNGRHPLLRLVVFLTFSDSYGWIVGFYLLYILTCWLSGGFVEDLKTLVIIDILHLAFLSLCYSPFKRIILNKSKRIKLFLACLIPAAIIETVLLLNGIAII